MTRRQAAAEFDLDNLIKNLDKNRPLRLSLSGVFSDLPVPLLLLKNGDQSINFNFFEMTEINGIDKKWMKRAIFLASLGKGKTSPNPLVGALILDKNGNLISEGFHYKAGMPHAEAMAFNNLKKDAEGGSMYVNLEPCCHQGRTPPCVNKVISSGIKKIFISIEDPDKRVSGKGIKLLKEAGIEVHLGLCIKESLDLNKAFIHRNITKKGIWCSQMGNEY